jgi:hypothetical protein
MSAPVPLRLFTLLSTSKFRPSLPSEQLFHSPARVGWELGENTPKRVVLTVVAMVLGVEVPET